MDNIYIPENKPELIVFDLDYTLWPFYTDCEFTYPYRIEKDKIKDANGSVVKAYKDTTNIIKYLHDQGYKLGIASRTTYTKEAKQLVELFKWKSYFQFVEIYGGSKVTHFRKISKDSGIQLDKMLFFDDEYRNVADLTPLGVTVAFIRDGLSIEALKHGLKQYDDKF